MRIERLTLSNFKAFQDAKLEDPPNFAVIVGANGAGKSTLFDVFGFLKDCLIHNVRVALQRRGGFREVVSRGHDGEDITIELKTRTRLAVGDRTVTYRVRIGVRGGMPLVKHEVLQYTRYGGGKPYRFIDFSEGKGSAITNEVDIQSGQPETREEQSLESPDILAIKGLGQFQRFEAASQFRALIESWHVSDFKVSSARPSQDEGYAEHMSPEGDNLALVTRFLYERHRPIFDSILKRLQYRVPGIERVEATATADGRIVLRFKDGQFKDPFIGRYVSDGTIKMFAYLVLLNDPNPHPLLCVEEPENQLYPSLLKELAEEFALYAKRGRGTGNQVFVSTHSPDFLNAVPLESVYALRKRNGFSEIMKADADENLRALVQEGDLPGSLWRQGLFEGVNP